ncbi:MAG: YhbY family RNA-binding protein [Oscillospiraceae bacterium]
MDTIFQVGKAGVNDQLIKQVDETLEVRELIKLRTLETSPQSTREAAEKISQETGCDVVQIIGSRFVLYRPSKDKKIKLVK